MNEQNNNPYANELLFVAFFLFFMFIAMIVTIPFLESLEDNTSGIIILGATVGAFLIACGFFSFFLRDRLPRLRKMLAALVSTNPFDLVNLEEPGVLRQSTKKMNVLVGLLLIAIGTIIWGLVAWVILRTF